MEKKPAVAAQGTNVLGVILFVVVAGIIGAAALIPFFEGEEGVGVFVAFKPGTTWRYRDWGKEGTRDVELRVTAQGKDSFEAVETGDRRVSWKLDGAYLVRETGTRTERFLQAGTRKGHSWPVDPGQPQGLKMKHLGIGPATAAGKRYEEAVNVRLLGPASWVDYYLVPGIGLVLEIESSYPDPALPSRPLRTRELLSFDAK